MDGLAPLLLRPADHRPRESRARVQDRRRAHRQRRRRQELHAGGRLRGHARRLARPLDRPAEPQAHRRRQRRRSVHLLRRRKPVVEEQQPAGLAVLPCGHRRPGSVPGVRRPPGQLELGSADGVRRRHLERRLGEPVRRRRVLDGPRSHRSGSGLCRGAGRVHRSRRSTAADRSRHPAEGELQGTAPLQLEHAHLREPHPEGDALHRRAGPLPLARSRRQLGAHLAGSDLQRSGEAEAGGIGWGHGGQLLRRGAHHDLLDQRVAVRREHHLGRHGRWQRAVDARRRKDLEQPGAQREGAAARVVGELGGGEPPRCGYRVRRVRQAHVRRYGSLGVPDDGLREELDAYRRAGAGRQGLRARGEGGPDPQGPPLRRHRARALDLGRWSEELGRVQGIGLPGGSSPRSADPSPRRRPDHCHARARDLDHRRSRSAARILPADACARGGVPALANYATADRGAGGMGGGRRHVHRPEPGDRGGDQLLPADPPPVRADQAGGSGRARQRR